MNKKIETGKPTIKDTLINKTLKIISSKVNKTKKNKIKGKKKINKHMFISIGVLSAISVGTLSWALIGAHNNVSKTYKVSDNIDVIIGENSYLKVIDIDATELFNKSGVIEARDKGDDDKWKENSNKFFDDLVNEVQKSFSAMKTDKDFIEKTKEAFLKTKPIWVNGNGKEVPIYSFIFQVRIDSSILSSKSDYLITYENNKLVFKSDGNYENYIRGKLGKFNGVYENILKELFNA